MLTGGGDDTEEANEQVNQVIQPEVVTPVEDVVVEKNEEIDEKVISYNDVNK